MLKIYNFSNIYLFNLGQFYKKNNERFYRNLLSYFIGIHFVFDVCYALVYRKQTRRHFCRDLGSIDFITFHCYQTKKKKMNLLIFIFGFIIFIVYVYFLLTIISRQHKIQRNEHQNAYDVIDMDGIGNQGRFPMDNSERKQAQNNKTHQQ